MIAMCAYLGCSPSEDIMTGTMARSSEGTATRCVTPSEMRVSMNSRGSVTTSCAGGAQTMHERHRAVEQRQAQGSGKSSLNADSMRSFQTCKSVQTLSMRWTMCTNEVQ